jgi:hypothetical protein
MNATNGLDQWAKDHNWALIITGLVVVLVASVLVVRALRRANAVRNGLTAEQRDTRQRRIEDAATIAVALVASGLSLTGLMKYAEDVLGLKELPLNLLPYFGLDAAVIVCAIRARRRSRNNESSGWNGRLVWVFAVISATFGYSEGHSVWSGLGRAVWPLIAATLFELGLIEQRHAAQRDVKRRLNLGWAHPLERLRVYSILSADSNLSADEATHEVRVNAAAKAMNRLRNADAAAVSGGRIARAKLRRVEHRTQRVLLRAKFSDPQVAAEVLQRTQAMVRTRDFARMDYSALDDARAMLSDAIDHTVVSSHPKRPRPAPRRPEQKTLDSAPSRTAAPAPQTSAPAPAARQPEQEIAPAVAEQVPSARAMEDQGARDPRSIVEDITREMIAEDDRDKPDAAEVRRRAGFGPTDKPVPATVRNWVKTVWEQHLEDRERVQREDARAEVHLADPLAEDEFGDAPRARHAGAA